jgi:hypothetical protein
MRHSTQVPRPETNAVRSDSKRLVLGIGGVLAIVVALVAVFNQGFDVTGCTAATPFGWLIPLVSAGVIGGVAWLLLPQSPRGSNSSDDYRSVDCTSCGRTVLTDWRLCPYCGAALSPDPSIRHGSLGD